MKQTHKRFILWALGVLTLISVGVAVWVGGQRIRWEAAYRQVSLAFTADAFLALQRAQQWEELTTPAYVVLDAANLEAFAALHPQPLGVFGELDEPFDTAALDAAGGAGLIVALGPLPLLDGPHLALVHRALDALAVQGVLFVETALRWRAEDVARVLDGAPRVRWAGVLEFYEPQGMAALYRDGWTQWVRGHLIPQHQRVVTSDEQALARYERAVRERSIRLLLFDLKDEPQRLADQVNVLSQRLERSGFWLGPVPKMPPWSLPQGVLWWLALALWAATLWLFQRLWFKRPWLLGALGVVLAGVVAWQLFRGDEGLQFLSLSMAILTPMCVYRALVEMPKRSGLGQGLRVLTLATGATVLGGLVQAALLSDPVYFLKLAEFNGVKLALIEPVLVIAYWALKRCGPGVWKQLWQRPLTWGDALLGVGVLGAFVLLIMRTGNDSLVPALPLEEGVRKQLEVWLYARPRFKEFLVGNPLLLLWSAWGIHRWKTLGVVVVLFAFLGQTTILNSFAHLHTPLAFTLLRVFNGLLLGAGVGALLWGIWRWGESRWQKPAL